MKVAVLLSGCGVFDGSEIHESVFSMLCLSQKKLDFFCVAPNTKQHHSLNHSNGEEILEERNVLIESSRISRADCVDLKELDLSSISSLVIPGGFGAAKNLSSWAFDGPNCSVHEDVKRLIVHCVENKKPVVSLCISPVVVAKSLEGTVFSPEITIGTSSEDSEYNIEEIKESLKSLGASCLDKSVREVHVDRGLNIISAPCYMMKADMSEVYENISSAINELALILKSN